MRKLIFRNREILHFARIYFRELTSSHNDTGKIIKGLDPNKAHGHDMISIRILKLCGGSIYKPLRLIFRACLDQGTFPCVGKKPTLSLFIKQVDMGFF